MVNKKIIENIPSFEDDFIVNPPDIKDECKYSSSRGYLDMFNGFNLIEAFLNQSFPVDTDFKQCTEPGYFKDF